MFTFVLRVHALTWFLHAFMFWDFGPWQLNFMWKIIKFFHWLLVSLGTEIANKIFYKHFVLEFMHFQLLKSHVLNASICNFCKIFHASRMLKNAKKIPGASLPGPPPGRCPWTPLHLDPSAPGTHCHWGLAPPDPSYMNSLHAALGAMLWSDGGSRPHCAWPTEPPRQNAGYKVIQIMTITSDDDKISFNKPWNFKFKLKWVQFMFKFPFPFIPSLLL